MSFAKQTAAILITLAALTPWAHAAPMVQAAQGSSGCGAPAPDCCCETEPVPTVSDGCACAPTPERAPAPVGSTNDKPPVPTMLRTGILPIGDVAPPTTAMRDYAHHALRFAGAPPGRVLHCVFRL